MNLQELIDSVKDRDPELAERLKKLAPPGENDFTRLKVQVNFKLEKFDGDYEPGKQPVEVITGGDDQKTVVTSLKG